MNVFITIATTVSDGSEKISTELDLEIWFCFSEYEVSAQWIISQNFLEKCGSSSQTFWPAQKLSQHELIFRSHLQSKKQICYEWSKTSAKIEVKLKGFLLPSSLEDFEMVDEIIMWIVLFFFCCFFIIKKLREVFSDAY